MAIKETVKKILFYVRMFFIIILAVGLFTTYMSLDKKYGFLLLLILIHFIIFGITVSIERKFFKNKNSLIKQHLETTWKIALLGIAMHVVNIFVLLLDFQFSLSIYHQFIVLGGIVCSAITIQRISFFKFI